ncbi:TLC domain-containing protein 2 [Python bivittatus]|uniref:TLC domain-containing protein 2 n=1 Tax=Python bivittatus TaxID=176946 RepID=A0A9F5J4M4_PYTBI|nr:TLC domain-containing protein 2 [Python bivittatus]
MLPERSCRQWDGGGGAARKSLARPGPEQSLNFIPAFSPGGETGIQVGKPPLYFHASCAVTWLFHQLGTPPPPMDLILLDLSCHRVGPKCRCASSIPKENPMPAPGSLAWTWESTAERGLLVDGISSSAGYFVQDFLDMMCNEKLQMCWELLFHHFVVIVCFGFAFLIRRFVGFAMVALLVEINSVFLHLRTILLMAGLAHTTSFRLTSLLNLGTYLVFRIMILAWMTRWLVLNQENVPAAPYAMGTVGMAIMLSINIVLFYRLLRSDFLPSHEK